MKRFALSAALVAAFAVPGVASAYAIFSGQDLNGDPTTPLASIPVSSAAEASFAANLTGVGTETFESQPTGATSPLVLSFPGAGTAALAGGGQVCEPVAAPGLCNDQTGRFSVPGGTKYWGVGVSDAQGAVFTITFSQTLAALGFYGIDIGDQGGTLSIEFLDASSKVIATKDVPETPSDGSVLFFGAIAQSAAEQFSSVRFRSTARSIDAFAFDNFTIGTPNQVITVQPTPTPEPASLALVGLALAGLGVARRRRA